MDTINLAGRRTTRLGFGTSSVLGSIGRAGSLRLLEQAFEAGIRHFDTAPLYGYGEAESCVGEFLRRHPGQLTVTTKFGIPAGQLTAKGRLVRAAGPLLQRFPAIKRRLTRGGTAATAADQAPKPPNPNFNAEAARQSIDRSLRALQVDRIDLLLLHELRARDLADAARADALLGALEDAVHSGKVGTFGIGSDRADVPPLLTGHPGFCPVVQCEWSVLDPLDPPQPAVALRIYHRALSERFHALTQRMRQDAALCRRLSDEVAADLANPAILAQLMLKASWTLNPQALLLFSSKHPGHIAGNVRTVEDQSLDEPARRLYAAFQRERLR